MLRQLLKTARKVGSLVGLRPRPFTGIGGGQKDYVIDWEPTYDCNYRCFYCFAAGGDIHTRLERERERRPPVERLIEIFAGIPSQWRVHLSGGEPLVYSEIIPLLIGVLQQRKVDMLTNLSIRIDELIESVPRSNFIITATWHPIPAHGDIEGFISRLQRLLRGGFNVSKRVPYVLHPRQLAQVGEFKERLEEVGFTLAGKVFRGTWQGRRYPDEHSPEEGRIVDEYLYDPIDRFPRPVATKGERCLAGCRTIVVRSDGSIHRCPDDRRVMGDFYAGEFPVYSEAMPCDVGGCHCISSIARGFVEGIDPREFTRSRGVIRRQRAHSSR